MSEPPMVHDIVRFIFELGQLRQESRHGWLRIYENPESVAEHAQRAACLGYLLAYCEHFDDPNLVSTMVLFHDMHETRIGDIDLVQKPYLNLQKHDEHRAAQDQLHGLGAAGTAIFQMWNEVDEHTTTAGKIAKDAEILEMAFTARELVVRGNAYAQEWMTTSASRLQTTSARELLGLIHHSNPCEWWQRISASMAMQ